MMLTQTLIIGGLALVGLLLGLWQQQRQGGERGNQRQAVRHGVAGPSQ